MSSFKYCNNCNIPIIGDKFCSRCGSRLATADIECANCYKSIPLGASFCHYCGYYVRISSDTAFAAAEAKERV